MRQIVQAITLAVAMLVGLTGQVCAQAAEPATADTPARTGAGHSFMVPAGWRLITQGSVQTLEAPEGNSRVAFVDVTARTADGAVAAAWQRFRGAQAPELTMVLPGANRNGWHDVRNYTYRTEAGAARFLTARAMRYGKTWAVRIEDMANAVAGKRAAELALIRDELLPRGYTRESFAGRTAHQLDAKRLQRLRDFLEESRVALGVPGLSVGIVQNDKVVLAEGFGVREAGKPDRVDADTLYLIASDTKPLTTLLLAKLVDEGRVGWDTPVAQVMPQFKLADAQATQKVQLKHLLCACIGLPYRNIDWEFAPAGAGPDLTFDILSRMQLTTAFGQTYQYSNPIAAAGGYVGGRIAYPDLALGEAYDRAMATRVFGPLGMTRTTFDFDRAMGGNAARAHGLTPDGTLGVVPAMRDRQMFAVRPTGGAWSNINDLLAYVRMELRGGTLADGTRYISETALKARWAQQIRTGKHAWYGMGLETNTASGTPLMFHGGRMHGFRSNMIWLPEHNVGAVILMNGSVGNVLMDAFPRRLMEILFDGQPEAASLVAATVVGERERLAVARRTLRFPADPADTAKLAAHYEHPFLGKISVSIAQGQTIFDLGPWQAPVASRVRPDGTSEFILMTPSAPFPFVAGVDGARRTLTIRDAQNSYVYVEAPAS
jgi:CubicO group peptidase (beta-lactamase class C family)